MSETLSYAEIAQALNQDAENFCVYVLGEQPSLRTPRELRFYPDGKLRVNINGLKKGKWVNFSDSSRGDMLDLYMTCMGVGKKEALDAAKAWLQISDHTPLVLPPKPDTAMASKEEEEHLQKRLWAAQGIWKRTDPLSSLGRQYLANRGITQIPEAVVRSRTIDAYSREKMHIDPELYDNRPLEAVVLMAQNAQGDVRAVQQILTIDGKKAKDVPNPKRTNGLMEGAVVQLAPAGDIVALAEGPETGLSVFQAMQMPVWVTLGSSNFLHAPIPSHTHTVLICADLEPSGAGLAMALKACDHWERLGKHVHLVLPEDPLSDHKVDFNDLLQTIGSAPIQEAFRYKRVSDRPGEGDRRAIVATCARNLLALWQGVGGRPILAKTGKEAIITPDLHIPDDVEEVILCYEGQAPDLQDILRRKPGLRIKLLPAPPTYVLEHLERFGGAWVRRAVDTSLEPGQQAFFQQELLALYPQAQVVLHQTRASAEAISSTNDHVHLAWNVKADLERWPWKVLRARTIVFAPSYGRLGIEGAAKAFEQVRSWAGTIKILEWPSGIVPSPTGFKTRTTPMPAHYDFSMALQEGWGQTRLQELYAKALVLQS